MAEAVQEPMPAAGGRMQLWGLHEIQRMVQGNVWHRSQQYHVRGGTAEV